MRITRRKFMGMAATAGAAMMLPVKWVGRGLAGAVANSGNLTKWIQPIRGLGPTGIPLLSGTPDPYFANTTFSQVTAAEFLDQLHPQLGPTRLWGYHDTTNPVKRHLAGVLIARRGTPNRIRFTNALPATHILPVDITVPGANQAQNRIAIHLHGGYVPWISDGGPFDWWTPGGVGGLSFQNGPGSVLDNIAAQPMQPGQADYYYPNVHSMRMEWYHDHAHGITRVNAYAGLASAYLRLDSINDAYVASGAIPGLASTIPLVFQDKVFVSNTTLLTDPTWALVARPDVQSVGSLWYDHVYDPKQFRMLKATKFVPPPNPSCIPEFFGDTMLANGLVYPLVTVEAKRYRFLVLNACNARFLNMNLLQVAPGAEVLTDPKLLFANLAVNPPGPPIVQIATEAGFLVKETSFPNNLPFNPVTLTGNLLLGPAERADVIIDFTGRAGQEFIVYNDAPGPFPVGPPTTDYFLGNPKNPVQPLPNTGPDTRQILRIKVVAAAIPDPQPAGPILNPLNLDPAPIAPITTTVAPIPPLVAPATAFVRDLTLNEDFDQFGRLRQLLGTTAPAPVGKGFGLDYLAPATEIIADKTTEVWRIFNLTADTHPIHFHLVNVQVLSRQPFKILSGVFTPSGLPRGPQPNELGWKSTVQMHPGEVTSVVMNFTLPSVPFAVPSSNRATVALNPGNPGASGMGLPAGTTYNEYVWHCHILEHEEHDMMRPLIVTGPSPQSLAVVPYATTVNGAAGGTATFAISGGTGPYTVTPVGLSLPADQNGAGFTVTVPPGTPPTGGGTPETYTITDSAVPTPAAVTATITIV